jgi:hypothetical protein|tara:strand:- start:5714 stop:5992 length:279 start_codon:yes stop_codon:yes gene_type:complete
MILEITVGILGFLVVTFVYTTFNLLRKNEKAEDIIVSQDEFIKSISSQIEKSQERLDKIDEKGSFKSDDEIGWFFNEVKKIQNDLSRYKTNL